MYDKYHVEPEQARMDIGDRFIVDKVDDNQDGATESSPKVNLQIMKAT